MLTASPSGLSTLEIGNTVIYIADKKTASGIWAPRLVNPELTGQYALTPDVPSVWVSGPYLVRTAWLEDSTVHLTGDLNNTTTIDVWGGPSISSVTWNGEMIEVQRTKTGSLQGTIQFALENGPPDVPNLVELDWKCAESTPELASDFDDSTWTLANKTQTTRPFKPYQGKVCFTLNSSFFKPNYLTPNSGSLFCMEESRCKWFLRALSLILLPRYGYHAGSWVWRGHFSGEANTSGVQLSVQT